MSHPSIPKLPIPDLPGIGDIPNLFDDVGDEFTDFFGRLFDDEKNNIFDFGTNPTRLTDKEKWSADLFKLVSEQPPNKEGLVPAISDNATSAMDRLFAGGVSAEDAYANLVANRLIINIDYPESEGEAVTSGTIPPGGDPWSVLNWQDGQDVTFDRQNELAFIRDGSNLWQYRLQRNPDGSMDWIPTHKNDNEIGGDGSEGGSGGISAGTAATLAQQAAQFAKTHGLDLAKFAQGMKEFDLVLAEQIRETNLSNETTRLRDVGNLGIQMADLSLRQQEHIQKILSQPSDFLARAFASRGEKSPFDFISQADLINALRDEFQLIADFTREQAANIASALAPLVPVGDDAVPPLVPGGLGDTPSPGATTGTDNPNDIRDGTIPPFQPTNVQPGLLDSADTLEALGIADSESEILRKAAEITAARAAGTFEDLGVAPPPLSQFVGPDPNDAVLPAPLPAPLPVTNPGSVGVAQDDPLLAGPPTAPTNNLGVSDLDNQLLGQIGFEGFEEGTGRGMTRLSKFIVDDQSGAEAGELILNPTGAPLGVLSNKQTRNFLRTEIPRFAQGTGVKSYEHGTSGEIDLEAAFLGGVSNIHDADAQDFLIPLADDAAAANIPVVNPDSPGTSVATVPPLSAAQAPSQSLNVGPTGAPVSNTLDPASAAIGTAINVQTNPNNLSGTLPDFSNLPFNAQDIRDRSEGGEGFQATLNRLFPNLGLNELRLMASTLLNEGFTPGQALTDSFSGNFADTAIDVPSLSLAALPERDPNLLPDASTFNQGDPRFLGQAQNERNTAINMLTKLASGEIVEGFGAGIAVAPGVTQFPDGTNQRTLAAAMAAGLLIETGIPGFSSNLVLAPGVTQDMINSFGASLPAPSGAESGGVFRSDDPGTVIPLSEAIRTDVSGSLPPSLSGSAAGTPEGGSDTGGTTTQEGDGLTTLQQNAFESLAEALGLTGQEDITQEELMELALEAQPPAVRDLLAGATVAPFRLASSFGNELPMFSPTQLNQLTTDELLALRTRLAVENISLDDVISQVNLLFGGNQAQRTATRRR